MIEMQMESLFTYFFREVLHELILHLSCTTIITSDARYSNKTHFLISYS